MRIAKGLVVLSAAAMVLGSVATGVPASAASAGSAPFSDISGSSAASAITFLSTLGIVNGVGGGMFDPSGPITRAEMAKVVVNVAGKGNVATALQNETPSFTDAASIPSWAWGYVNVAADMGIVNGFPNGTFQPNAPVTDVQAAAMLVRAIGDQNQVVGTWPGNYVAAAFDLGITNGIQFVANLPATRADVAQMAFNAAAYAPVYTATTTNSITSYAKGLPLYQAGPVNGNQVFSGTVTGVSSTGLTWSTPTTTSSGGTSTTTTSKNWASTYQLAGVNTLSSLIGESVLVNVDANGNVNFLTLGQNQSATTNSGTLASTTTAVPSGFFAVNSDWPWLVTNSYDCGMAYNGGNSVAYGSLGAGTCAGSYSLLLGGSSPTTVQLATYATATTGTTFAVNPASDGSDAGTVANVTYLSENDAVTYTLNSNKQIASLTEQNANDSIGLVTSTSCTSGCDNTINTGATPQITVSISGHSYTVNIQPYTQLTLNGASATVSKALDNTVAYISTVGGYGTNVNGSSNPGTGDGNAAVVALYQNQVTGTVTAINTSSSAPNISGGNSGEVSSFSLSLTNGSSQTYTADANFQSGSLVVGATVTVALDQSGDALAVINTSATTQPTVALVTGTGSQQAIGGQPVDTITVQDSSGAATFDVPAAYTGAVYSSTYESGYCNTANTTGCDSAYPGDGNSPSALTTNGNNGAILFITNPTGQAVAAGSSLDMSLMTPGDLFPGAPSNDLLSVVSTTSSSAVLGLYTCGSTCGTSSVTWTLDTAHAANPYLSVVAGGAFAGSTGDNLGFSGLNTSSTGGKWVSVYRGLANGQAYYAVVALTQ